MKYVNIIGRKIFMLYWAIMKPLNLGVRVIVIYKNEVLLVKHTYVKGYYFPGGGVSKSELFETAAKRELFEEVGITAHDLSLFGVYQSVKEKKYTTNAVFIVTLPKRPTLVIQKSELRDAQFFSTKNLPKDISPGTRRRIAEYLEGRAPLASEW